MPKPILSLSHENKTKTMKQLVKKEEASQIIAPYLPIFKESYDVALNYMQRVFAEVRQPLFQRTKATLLHNLVVNEICKRLENDPRIRIVEQYETITLVIDEKLFGRFKKLNDEGLASNIQTDRSDAIINQQLELAFPDVPAITGIDIGYVIDAAWSTFDSLSVVCRKNDAIKWLIEFESVLETAHSHSPVVEMVENHQQESARVVVKNKENSKLKIVE